MLKWTRYFYYCLKMSSFDPFIDCLPAHPHFFCKLSDSIVLLIHDRGIILQDQEKTKQKPYKEGT